MRRYRPLACLTVTALLDYILELAVATEATEADDGVGVAPTTRSMPPGATRPEIAKRLTLVCRALLASARRALFKHLFVDGPVARGIACSLGLHRDLHGAVESICVLTEAPLPRRLGHTLAVLRMATALRSASPTGI